MSVDFRSSERRRYVNDLQAREKEIAAVLKVSSPSSPKAHQQLNDKRVRREIANGNERRRMQCINAGFTSLRALIPHLEGEKLSKAAILQQSIDYITSLEKDKSRLQMQLERTTRLLADLGQQDRVLVDSFVTNTPPPSKRKKRDTESSDEGVGSLSDASDDCGNADLRQKYEALRHQSDREKQRGDSLEEENKGLRNLIFLIQKNARDSQPLTVVAASAQPQETRVRDVAEVMPPRLNYTPPLHQGEVMEYSIAARPASLTPDSTIVMTATATPPINSCRSVDSVSILTSDAHMDHRDTPSAGYHSSASPSLISMSSPGLTTDNVITSTNAMSTSKSSLAAASSSDSAFLHNYAHRDHPRRRHHQAQLERERIEEEERQQKEHEEIQLRLQQQQQRQSLTTSAYIPRSSVHSLDILAEAANHVKDERTTHLYEEVKPFQMGQPEDIKSFQMSQPVVYQLSEDAVARLGIHQDIVISENERLSPSSTILTSSAASLHQPMLHQDSHIPIIVTTAASSDNSSSSSNLDRSSSFSEKYPIATHLLHRPLHTPFTRPGVIVQKH